jgi:hypothetical protein
MDFMVSRAFYVFGFVLRLVRGSLGAERVIRPCAGHHRAGWAFTS